MPADEIDARLKGARLEWRPYRMPRPGWDHDHCEFCYATFMEPGNKNSLPEGYYVPAEDTWICPDCFKKECARYEWVVG
ncbi:MAG: hypothetical protein ACXVB9_05770 [Bdellovibrionota bacterium]